MSHLMIDLNEILMKMCDQWGCQALNGRKRGIRPGRVVVGPAILPPLTILSRLSLDRRADSVSVREASVSAVQQCLIRQRYRECGTGLICKTGFRSLISDPARPVPNGMII